MKKTYDTLLIPTGETSFGDRSFPVSKKAVELYNSGKFGSIFITGGHNGLTEFALGETINESEDTRKFLLEQGISEKHIYADGQSLDTLGNFTFPIIRTLEGNPSLLDFRSILIVGKSGHLWRAKDYAGKVFPKNKVIEYETIEGPHNNGLIARVYHQALMHALNGIKEPSAEEAHAFLVNNHPFYSEGWFDKSPVRRKIEAMAIGLSWFLK